MVVFCHSMPHDYALFFHDGLNNPRPRPPRWCRPCSLHVVAGVVAVSMRTPALSMEAGCVACVVFVEPVLSGHAATGTRTHSKLFGFIAPSLEAEQRPDWHCLLLVQPAMLRRRAPRHAQQRFRQANAPRTQTHGTR